MGRKNILTQKREIELNENDIKLLNFCKDRAQSLSDVARHLNIAPKNVSQRIPKLEKLGFIRVTRQEKKGMKTYVLLNNLKTMEHAMTKEIITILKDINSRGGTVSVREFENELDRDYYVEDKFIMSAGLYLLHCTNFLKREISLTNSARHFINEEKSQ